MCGFTAMVAVGEARAERGIVERMAESIRHRGPDDNGTFSRDRVALSFRRLSILDLSPAGHQPMESADGQAVIVFNGEIFNYVELRQELEAHGHTFRSSGDTEVLLAAYRHWGRECLPRLNGMFAFLIYDHARGVVFGARDRFGIKPLYWHRAGDRYLFASEIKAIHASGLYEAAADWSTVADYLVLEHLSAGDDAERTFWSEVSQVRPGTAFELTLDGRRDTWQWWSLEDAVAEATDDPPARFVELFNDSVKLRLRSDVPVGVCLSGGLDSTSILCEMARQRAEAGGTEPFEAFTYNAAKFDESTYVADTIAQTGAHLNRIELRGAPDWDELKRIMWFYDQPVHSTSALVGYELMKLAASRGVTVVLNGQGADEALAGYGDYFQRAWYGLLTRGRILKARSEIRAFAEAQEQDADHLFKKAVRYTMRTQFRRSRTYRKVSHGRVLKAGRALPWFQERLLSHLPTEAPDWVSGSLRTALVRSVQRDPLPLFLRCEDRNSMAYSLESRLPFMDWRLMAFAFSLEDHWKIRGPWNKFILREGMRGRIPESVRARVDKMGFPTMHRDWFSGPWYEPMMDLLSGQRTRERELYDTDALKRGLERHRAGEIDISEPLLTNVAQTEIWLATLESPEPVREPAPPSLVSTDDGADGPD